MGKGGGDCRAVLIASLNSDHAAKEAYSPIVVIVDNVALPFFTT